MVLPALYIALMFHVATLVDVLDVRRGVGPTASLRLSLRCVMSLQDGDPSSPRWVVRLVVVDASVTCSFYR